MPTFTTIGTNVLTRLGLCDPGAGVSASDLSFLQTICNEMLSAWSIDRPLIYTLIEQSFALVSGTGSYTIGLGGTFDTTPNGPPNHIEQAFIKTGTQRNELTIVNAQQYRAHNDLAATSSCPDEMYPDYSFGASLANVSFWPIPTFTGSLNVNINYWQPLPSFPDLTTNVPLRDGYQECIEWNLAYKALPTFGMSVQAATAEIVAQQADSSQRRVRNLNNLNGMLPAEQPTVSQPQQQVPPAQR
jgi:hypothetical protein